MRKIFITQRIKNFTRIYGTNGVKVFISTFLVEIYTLHPQSIIYQNSILYFSFRRGVMGTDTV